MSTLEELTSCQSALLASIPDVPLHTIFDLDHKDLLLADESEQTPTTLSISATVATLDLSDPETLNNLLAPPASNASTAAKAECSVCGKRFSNASALAKHRLTHSQERRYPCPLCHKAFKRQDHLNGHLLTHRATKPFACNVCEKSYCDARSLRRHRENHHGHQRLRVQQEQALIKDHSALKAKRVRSRNNRGNKGSEAVETGNVAMRCAVCNRSFKNAAALNGHMRLHGGFAKGGATTSCSTTTTRTAISITTSSTTTTCETSCVTSAAVTAVSSVVQPDTNHLLAMLDTSSSLPCIRLPTHPLPPLLVSLPTLILAPAPRLVVTTERRPRVGDEFQALVPDLVENNEEPEEEHEEDDLMWRPETETLVSSASELESYLAVANSCLMAGGGANTELALQVLETNKGDLVHSMQSMLKEKSEDNWESQEVDAFYRHLILQKKSFDKFAETNKSRAECVDFYYAFKNVAREEARQIKQHWNNSDFVVNNDNNGNESGSSNSP